MRDWLNKDVLKEFWNKLILDVYFEFIHNQRDQRLWEAGMEVMNKIG